MTRIIVAPDKFKGSLSTFEACKAIKDGIREIDDKLEIVTYPMSDGGDGFAEVMKHYLKTQTIHLPSVDPVGKPIASSYEWNEKDKMAIIELANCSGLASLRKEERNPTITSTYGTGLQIKHAFAKGAEKIVLGLGGSATNDGGTGILAALGFSFQGADGKTFMPKGGNLVNIDKIVPPQRIPKVQLQLACDVNNPLFGKEGAAFVFGPQKGAKPEQVELLDRGLRNLAAVIKKQTEIDVSLIPGTGASGGIAAGLLAWFDVKILKGTNLILSASGLENFVSEEDIIVTGEGKLDEQSLRGKTISAICELAKTKGAQVVAICGKSELKDKEWKEMGLSYVSELREGSMSEEETIKQAASLLSKKARKLGPVINKFSTAKKA